MWINSDSLLGGCLRFASLLTKIHCCCDLLRHSDTYARHVCGLGYLKETCTTCFSHMTQQVKKLLLCYANPHGWSCRHIKHSSPLSPSGNLLICISLEC